MAFQSEFADNDKLNKAAVNDGDHIGEQFSPKGPWVVLIKKALNAWAAKQRPPVTQIPVNDVFGRETGDLVALYKTRQAPPILNFAGKIDRIVGKKTVVALDKELPAKGGGSSITPDMQLVNAADLRRFGALTKAEVEIQRLKQAFEPNVPDENDPVVQALQASAVRTHGQQFLDLHESSALNDSDEPAATRALSHRQNETRIRPCGPVARPWERNHVLRELLQRQRQLPSRSRSA